MQLADARCHIIYKTLAWCNAHFLEGKCLPDWPCYHWNYDVSEWASHAAPACASGILRTITHESWRIRVGLKWQQNLENKITKWFKNSVMCLRILRVCLWFPWAFLRGVVLCVCVLAAAVRREQLGLHTLEDFHIPRCFEFGDRSPFWRMDFCARGPSGKRGICAQTSTAESGFSFLQRSICARVKGCCPFEVI